MKTEDEVIDIETEEEETSAHSCIGEIFENKISKIPLMNKVPK